MPSPPPSYHTESWLHTPVHSSHIQILSWKRPPATVLPVLPWPRGCLWSAENCSVLQSTHWKNFQLGYRGIASRRRTIVILQTLCQTSPESFPPYPGEHRDKRAATYGHAGKEKQCFLASWLSLGVLHALEWREPAFKATFSQGLNPEMLTELAYWDDSVPGHINWLRHLICICQAYS